MDIAIDFQKELESLSRAYPTPEVSADIRCKPEDFKVSEILGFEPSGSGEHLFLRIEKTKANTQWVFKQLQKTFGLSSKEIGYAGKKDRHSVSTQWFSLHMPGKDVDLALLKIEGIRLIKAVRHNKKLKVGSLKRNKFEIVLRNVSGPMSQSLVEEVVQKGVPNYFGSQRFGFDANNLYLANDYLTQRKKIKNRDKRGLVISSARSFIFNSILSKRIKDENWLTIIKGDCLNLEGSQSFFRLDFDANEEDRNSEEIRLNLHNEQSRIDSGDVHVSGLLPGRKVSDAQLEAKDVEDNILAQFTKWQSAFYRLNLSTDRRAFRCIPKQFVLKEENDTITVSFELNKGCYATSVIREMVNVTDKSLSEEREST